MGRIATECLTAFHLCCVCNYGPLLIPNGVFCLLSFSPFQIGPKIKVPSFDSFEIAFTFL